MSDTSQAPGTPGAAPTLPNNFTMSGTGERLDSSSSVEQSTPDTKQSHISTTKENTQVIPQEALTTRLERARKAERERILKSLGYESADKAKADFEELKKLRVEKEASEREKMTELQRFQTDLETERKLRIELEGKLKEESNARLYEKQDAAIYQIAARHVDSSSLKLKTAKREFAEYIDSLPKSQVSRMNEKDIEKWFSKFTKENPEFARKDAPVIEVKEEPKAVEPLRKPAGAPPIVKKTGAPQPVGTSKDPALDTKGKTPRPGLPNSMTRAELTEYLKKMRLQSYR
jgi:TolA-binding protein